MKLSDLSAFVNICHHLSTSIWKLEVEKIELRWLQLAVKVQRAVLATTNVFPPARSLKNILKSLASLGTQQRKETHIGSLKKKSGEKRGMEKTSD